VGTKKVRRLMKEDNLLAVRRRKFVVTTDSDHGFEVYPNLTRLRLRPTRCIPEVQRHRA